MNFRRYLRLVAITSFSLLAMPGHATPKAGDVDPAFDPQTSADGIVHSVAVQPDGKIIIAGEFHTINGVTRNGIVRLNPDGSLDAGFQGGMDGLGFGGNYANALAVQPDGKVIVGGYFDGVNGTNRGSIARLNADGSLDTGFQNEMAGAVIQYCFSNFECYDLLGEIYSVAVQTNGTVLVGGHFDRFNLAVPSPHARYDGNHHSIARLNSDGSLDTSFQDNWLGTDPPYVNSVVAQPDGKAIVAGNFGIQRLNVNGRVDTNFQAVVFGGSSFLDAVALQADGKVLLAGSFTSINGTNRNRIARLNANGSLDTTFQNGMSGADDEVLSIAVQPDGKVLLGGRFSFINGVTRTHLARLNANGSLDTNFQNGMAGTDDAVLSFAIQSDSKVLIGGRFLTVNGTTHSHIARLYGVTPLSVTSVGVVSNQFGFDITGDSNQIVIVEASTNLVGWTDLATNTLGAGPLHFNDPGSTNFQKRFYRARLVP